MSIEDDIVIRKINSHPLARMTRQAFFASIVMGCGTSPAQDVAQSQSQLQLQLQLQSQLRQTLAARVPALARIDEISPTPIAGLYEVRVGTNVYYVDDKGDHLIEGQILDTRTRTNLTEARLAKLTAIDFAALPLGDAIVWTSGTGRRKLAVFADPNCGYCKHLEQTALQQLKDVTVYTFLIPILGGDSPEKARAIWCAKDTTAAWRRWMLDGNAPPRAMGACDASALERNLAAAKRYRITATPSLVFEDGARVPGAADAPEIERHLSRIASAGG